MVFVFLLTTSRYATNASSNVLSNSVLAVLPTTGCSAVPANERVFTELLNRALNHKSVNKIFLAS